MAHAGLDTAVYPGDDVARDLFARTNLAFIPVYAKGPSHHDDSFRGKCAVLRAMGWGLAPVYVGQQRVGPGSHVLTAAQGAIDGADFAAWMVAEGFVPASKGWLDHEGGDDLDDDERAYIDAFATAFEAAGFRFGVYCAHHLAEQMLAIWPTALIWAVKVPPFDPINGDEFDGTTFPNTDPAMLSGVPGAVMCQCREEVRLTAFAGLHADLDTSTCPDPSAP